MHPEDIKAAIRKSGCTPAQIARDLQVSSMAVTHAIRGQTSTRIAKRISEITGKRFSELWPGKYSAQEFVEKAAAAGKKSASKRKAVSA